MKMILSGGGTAGHIYPALSLAAELRARGHEVIYLGTPAGPEARLVPAAGFPFVALKAAGFDRARPLTLLTSTLTVVVSALRAWRLFGRLQPAAVVGFGGYVSIPVGLAARWRRVPLVLHEQNSVLGMTNRFLARHARFVGVTYAASSEAVRRVLRDPQAQVAEVGNPVRTAVVTGDRQQARAQLGIAADDTLLLVFGGSRGARHINTALLALAARGGLAALTTAVNLRILHAAGTQEYESVVAALAALPAELRARWTVVPYLDDMPTALAAADCALTRAGATTLAELTAAGLPAVLVPYPHATDDHQTGNARAAGEGFLVVADADLDGPAFAQGLEAVLSDPARRAMMREQARRGARPRAAADLADAVERVAGAAAGAAAGESSGQKTSDKE